MSESLGLRVRLRWWGLLAWLRRCPECHQRGYGTSAPRWDADPIAYMLGAVGHGRCDCCGKYPTPPTTHPTEESHD